MGLLELLPLVRRILGVVFPPSQTVESGVIEVGAAPVALPGHLLLRGVWLTVDDAETVPVFVGGVVGAGYPAYPGQTAFIPIANSNLLSLVAPVGGYTTVTVYWWAA